MNILVTLLQDALFAGIAGVGFGSISNLPFKGFPYCAMIAGIGHALRCYLTTYCEFSIIWGSFIAALTIGLLSVIVGIRIKQPAESLSFPSLLPMIPGMYAYRTFQHLLLCVSVQDQNLFLSEFYNMSSNLLVGTLIVFMLAIGALIPLLSFGKFTFQATRNIIRF